ASNARRASSTFEVGRRLLLEPRCSERRVAVEVELDPRQAAVPEGHHRRRSTLDGRLGSLRCRLMPSERYEMLAAHAQLLDLDRARPGLGAHRHQADNTFPRVDHALEVDAVALEGARPVEPYLAKPLGPGGLDGPPKVRGPDHRDLEARLRERHERSADARVL